jgi:hypothetical protein
MRTCPQRRTIFTPPLPRERHVSGPRRCDFCGERFSKYLGTCPQLFIRPLSRTAAEKPSANLAERAFIASLMGSRSDPRRVVGTRVHAKALHVTSEAECRRRYGSLQGTKLVSGTVVDVEISKTGQRANVIITKDFNLGPSFVKRKRLNGCSVYAGEAPAHIPSAADAQGICQDPLLSRKISNKMTTADES